MKTTRTIRPAPSRRDWMRPLWLGIVALAFLSSAGCAAMSNPVADGIDARRIPPEFLASPKADLQTIPLPTLSQLKPVEHVIGPDDILGVYIEGIWGERNQPPPVRFPEQGNLPPAVGFPIPVGADGTLPLPYVPPVKVAGLTLQQAEEAIRKAYTVDQKILIAGRERILLTLMKARQFRIQVVRQETPQVSFSGGLQTNTRRGIGATIDLPIYENDVLNALNRTGGLPGLDSINEVIIQRNVKGGEDVKVVRIPLRIRKGSALPFQPDDVILNNGDVVFIEARDTEVYYVGGLTIPRQFTLPRDYDLRVTEALALAGGPLVNGAFNQNNLQGAIIQSGLGSPSPSNVTVIRRTQNGGQVKIIVNLNRALNDPRENIILMTGDMLIVQETVGEALTRYITNTFRLNVFSVFNRNNPVTTGTYTGP